MGEKKFKLSMLEYSKIILSKISFDKQLFRKEYEKAVRCLDNNERTALEQWVQARMEHFLNT
jgi:hypothetical protein